MSRVERVSGRVRAVIVDDEPLARDCVRIALEAIPEVEVVAECGDGLAAVSSIRNLEPDLVLLDVQMPGLDGFGVIEEVGVDEMPMVVFITAYDEHALRAFEIHAVDYLLKPFDDERFRDAVRHALERIQLRRTESLSVRLAAVLREMPPGLEAESGVTEGAPASGADRYARRILVKRRDRFRFIEVRDVDYFEAAGNYVRVHAGEATHLMRATLSGTLERLDPARFARIHRSTIVNLDRIREIQPWVGGDYIAILEDGRELRVSRTYREALLRPLA